MARTCALLLRSYTRRICREINEIKQELTYGWGMITCKIVVEGREYKTAITPRDGTYYIPLKDEIRKRHGLAVGDQVELQLLLGF